MRMDIQTDRDDEINSRFSQFCEKRLKTDDGITCFSPTFSIKWKVYTKQSAAVYILTFLVTVFRNVFLAFR